MKYIITTVILSLCLACTTRKTSIPTEETNTLVKDCTTIFNGLAQKNQAQFYTKFLDEDTYFNSMKGTKKSLCVPSSRRAEVFHSYRMKFRSTSNSGKGSLTHLCIIKEDGRNKIDLYYTNDTGASYSFHGLEYFVHNGEYYYTLSNDDFKPINIEQRRKQIEGLGSPDIAFIELV